MKRFPLLFLVTLLIAVAITACAPAAEVEAPAAEAPVNEEAPAADAPVDEAAPVDGGMEEGATYDDAAMEALITEKAAGNHTLDFILSQDFTREEWEETLDRMIAYGAQISDEEKELIIDWLLSRNE